jgi:hypothetical protein
VIARASGRPKRPVRCCFKTLHPELTLLELPRFHLLNRRLVIRPKGGGRQIGGKAPPSYPSRTSARPTTRPITVSNPVSCPACDHTTTTVALVRPKVPRAIHVPACRSFPINCASLDRRPYQVGTACQHLPHPSARVRAFRRLHLNLAGRGLQPLSYPYRRPGSTPISRITPPSL